MSSAVLTVKNEVGCTALQMAVEIQWSVGIGLLLKAGADVTQSAKDGSTVLHKAAVTGNTDLLEEILELEGMYQVGIGMEQHSL